MFMLILRVVTLNRSYFVSDSNATLLQYGASSTTQR